MTDMREYKNRILFLCSVILAAGLLTAGCGSLAEVMNIQSKTMNGSSEIQSAPASETEESLPADTAGTEDGMTVSGNEGQEGAASADDVPQDSVSANGVSQNRVPTDTATGAVSGNTQAYNAAVKSSVKVKGIYVSGAMAGTSGMDRLIDLVDRTELNAMVIDIKNDEGRVVYSMNSPLVQQIGAAEEYITDMPGLVRRCREHGIYLIARVVAFKDPWLAEKKPEWSLHTQDGLMFRDKSGLAWVNPYRREVWDYLVEIGEQAAAVGFDEIQYDYIRFSTDSGMKKVDFGEEAQSVTKEEIITGFVSYAAERLHAADVSVSADVYGVVIDSRLDAGIVGQNYYNMAKYLDYISPMVYPSHYGPGNLGLKVPDAQPYETIYRTMSASREVLAGSRDMNAALTGSSAAAKLEQEKSVSVNQVSANTIPDGADSADGVSANGVSGNAVSGNPAEQKALPKDLKPSEEIHADVRPWLQDFTATWVKGHITYGPEQIRQQIQAVYDAGYEEWILWNAANRYTEGGLLAE